MPTEQNHALAIGCQYYVLLHTPCYLTENIYIGHTVCISMCHIFVATEIPVPHESHLAIYITCAIGCKLVCSL